MEYAVFVKVETNSFVIRLGGRASLAMEASPSKFLFLHSYRFLAKVDRQSGIQPEHLAPLTDAGVTPYRALKKVRKLLGPGKTVAILGIGGLGSYGIQYAKILSLGSKVIALGRNDKKLELAQNFGADHV